jgi:hypothetical protein
VERAPPTDHRTALATCTSVSHSIHRDESDSSTRSRTCGTIKLDPFRHPKPPRQCHARCRSHSRARPRSRLRPRPRSRLRYVQFKVEVRSQRDGGVPPL